MFADAIVWNGSKNEALSNNVENDWRISGIINKLEIDLRLRESRTQCVALTSDCSVASQVKCACT